MITNYMRGNGVELDAVSTNKINSILQNDDWTYYIDDMMNVVCYPMIEFLTQIWGDEKQTKVDLLAVQTASKNAIIDGTDYVALSYAVDNDGHSIPPPDAERPTDGSDDPTFT